MYSVFFVYTMNTAFSLTILSLIFAPLHTAFLQYNKRREAVSHNEAINSAITV